MSLSFGVTLGFPPINYAASVGASVGFPGIGVSLPCGISIGLPPFSIGIFLSLAFSIILPDFSFFLSLCDLSAGISVGNSLSGSAAQFGGGRPFNAPPDPDLNDDTP
jgi:hypothetical protein